MANKKISQTATRLAAALLSTDEVPLYIPTEALPADQNQRAALSAIQAYLAASFASTAQGALADSATQPGDNVSSLTNDAGYTNDQTGAEIKSAYEAEADTNAFTDAAQTKLGHITITQAVDLDAIETRVNALDASVVLMGVWDASVGTFPGGGTAQAGESWIVSVGGTVGGVVFAADDRLIAIVDNASTGTYAANWHKADYSDLVQSVAGLTGAVSASGLRTAINVEDGADVTDAANVLAALAAAAADIDVNAQTLRDVNGIELAESADHPETPAAGKGQVWVSNGTRQRPQFTDDAGVDFDLVYHVLEFTMSDEETPLTTGQKFARDMAYGMVITRVYASLTTAGTTSAITVDIEDEGTSILNAVLSISAGSNNAETSTFAAAASSYVFSKGDLLTADIDSVDSGGTGAGLQITLEGYRTDK